MEFHEDPAKHVMLQKVESLAQDAFFAQLSDTVNASSKKDAFVFVHGFNVSFEDAARRTAQLAYDLKFEGAPVFFSWPSQGLFLEYTVDEANAEWTIPHLKAFLKSVATRSGAQIIHLIAHSMGNRALTRALQGLMAEEAKNPPRFSEVILAAPDIDADVFKTQIFPGISSAAQRLTLYASSRDRALQLSKQVHGYPRAGESGDDIVVMLKMDTIDVSNVDTSLIGHSYYGDNNSFLADAFYLIHGGLPPERRERLRSVPLGSLKYWMFAP
ncbi:MAG: alpha/beta fold hydrolase [Planctomycetes bacterium]|nr:alpha/beta fold hydrolase [Planctomycetota bacterium]